MENVVSKPLKSDAATNLSAPADAVPADETAAAVGSAVESETNDQRTATNSSNSPQKRKLSADESSAASSAPDPDAIKMFVGQIPKTWEEADARKFFEHYGEIHQVYILRDKSSHTSKGCCFVTYCTREAALQAQRSLHDVHRLPGMKHAVQMKPADVESKNERKLFVGMIPKSYDEQDVERLFQPYGVIEETSILRDNAGKSRGCAFVTFQNKSSVYQSIRSLHLQTTLQGCSAPMVVKLADSQRDRDRRRSVQTLLNSMGIDCRTANGTSLLKLFSGNQQPFATMELNAIRQLILSSGNTLAKYTTTSTGGSSDRPHSRDSFYNSTFSMPTTQPVNDLTARLMYASSATNGGGPNSSFQNKYSTPAATHGSFMPETNQNSATLELLKQLLSTTSSNDNSRHVPPPVAVVDPSNSLAALSHAQVAGNTSSSTLLNGIISALSKSLNAAGAVANPINNNNNNNLYGASSSEQQYNSYAAAPHTNNNYSNGYANNFAGYDNNSGYSAALGYGAQQSPAQSYTTSSHNSQQPQSKRQRSSNTSSDPSRSHYDYQY